MQYILVCVFLWLDNAVKFFTVWVTRCCLFVGVFYIENVAVHRLSLSSRSGGGLRQGGCDAGICVNSGLWCWAWFILFLLPSPPRSFSPAPQRHPRVWANCVQRRHRASHRQQPAAGERSPRSDSASPPPVPQPPWPRTAGTGTVGVSKPVVTSAARPGTDPSLSASGDEAGQGLGDEPHPSCSLSGGRNHGRAVPVQPESRGGATVAASRRPEPPAPAPRPRAGPPPPSIWTAPTACLWGTSGSALAIGWQEGEAGGAVVTWLRGEEWGVGDAQPPLPRELRARGPGRARASGGGRRAGTMRRSAPGPGRSPADPSNREKGRPLGSPPHPHPAALQ